jgi:hypothetical protein
MLLVLLADRMTHVCLNMVTAAQKAHGEMTCMFVISLLIRVEAAGIATDTRSMLSLT